MAWPFGHKSEPGAGAGPGAEPEPERLQPRYLDDMKPKFQEPDLPPPPTMAEAWATVKLADLSLARLAQIPCFRDAVLTGALAAMVLGGVTYAARRRVNSSVNWAFGGFFLGSALAWRQCRVARQRLVQQVGAAKVAARGGGVGP